jgi:hypothetical protein
MYSARAVVTHSPLQRLPVKPPFKPPFERWLRAKPKGILPPQPVWFPLRVRLSGLALVAELPVVALPDLEAPTRRLWPRFAPCSKRPLPRSNRPT